MYAWKVKWKSWIKSWVIYFTAHTLNCVCHSIWSMFRVLGIYNFGIIASSGFYLLNVFLFLLKAKLVSNLHCDQVWLCSTNNIFGYRCLIASKARTQHAEAEWAQTNSEEAFSYLHKQVLCYSMWPNIEKWKELLRKVEKCWVWNVKKNWELWSVEKCWEMLRSVEKLKKC